MRPIPQLTAGGDLSGLYGPNAVLVHHFLEHLGTVALEELGDVVRRWRETIGPAWLAAEEAAVAALRTSGRGVYHFTALESLVSVFERRWLVRYAPKVQIWADYAAMQYVAETVLVALLLRDCLSAEHFGLLYEPFAALIPLAHLEAEADVQ